MNQDDFGLANLGKGIRIKAYPNPSNGLVHLMFDKALKNAEISLSELSGKVIFNKKLNTAINEQIHLDGPAGIYLLRVKSSEGQTVMKLIKE